MDWCVSSGVCACFWWLVENISICKFICMIVILQPGFHPAVPPRLPWASPLICQPLFCWTSLLYNWPLYSGNTVMLAKTLLSLFPTFLPGLPCGIFLFFSTLKCWTPVFLQLCLTDVSNSTCSKQNSLSSPSNLFLLLSSHCLFHAVTH